MHIAPKIILKTTFQEMDEKLLRKFLLKKKKKTPPVKISSKLKILTLVGIQVVPLRNPAWQAPNRI